MGKLKVFLNRIRHITALKVLGYASLPFFAMFSLFIMDYMNFYQYQGLSSVISFVNLHPMSYLFELLVIASIFVILLLICRKAAIAGALLGGLSCLFAFINYMKIALNGDNFFPRDIIMAKSAGELMQFLSGSIPVWFFLGMAVLIVWVLVFAALDTEIPLRWRIRLPIATVIVAAALIIFSNPANASATLSRFGMSFENAFLQSSNYEANGFLGAFTLNLLSMNVETPDGYSQETVQQILAPYSYTATSEGALEYDVIVVLSESFFDIRELPGVTFSQNPLPNYDRILKKENCYSGKIYTTALGGGTARPEFEILTGLSYDYLPSGSSPYEYVVEPLKTNVSHYKDNGYSTTALHLYDPSFYARNTAYPLMGFDTFYSLDNLSGIIDMEYKRGYATDETTLTAMKYCLNSASQPAFLSTVTIQNHQPFAEIDSNLISIDVGCDALSESELTAVSTYTQGLYDADKFLGQLIDYIDSRSRPTVLLFYGDHLPTLGSNHGAYNSTGYCNTVDGLTSQELQKLFSTPFLIYSNQGYEDGFFPSNTGNKVSSYYMLPIIAKMTGFERSPYMNLLLDSYESTPYYNRRLLLDETDSTKALTAAMRYITYDRLCGKAYSE